MVLLVVLVFFCSVVIGDDTFACPDGPDTVAYLDPNTLAALYPQLDALVSSFSQAPNVAAGLVYNQQLLWFGGKGSNISPDSAFRIGSNSKVFTSLLVLLQQHGQLDQAIETYFPQVAAFRYPGRPDERMTWRNLLSHRAGLPRESPCQGLWGACSQLTLESVLGMATQWPALEPMNSRPSYSNLGFALAGHMMANLSGSAVPFEVLMEKKIFSVLNMTHTGYVSPKKNIPYLVPGYEFGGSFVVPNYDFGWENPAGGMYSSVRDLQKFMSMLFGNSSSMLLSPVDARRWLDPVWVSASSAYGCPWEMEQPQQKGWWLRGKAGAVLGYTSQTLLIPEIQMGVIVLCNGGLSADAGSLAKSIASLSSLALKNALQRLATSSPAPPPPQNIVGQYIGKPSSSSTVVPPFLEGLNATISYVAGQQQQLKIVALATLKVPAMQAIAMPIMEGYLEYNDQAQMFLLKSDQPNPSCASETGGAFQWIQFNGTTFQANGQYYGFIFSKL